VERASRLIPGVLARIVRPAPLCDEKVAFAWRLAVGPALARVTTVRLDPNAVLKVAAPTEHWRREVRRSSAVILARLEPLLGPDVVRRIDA
jgi:predicted nucleic acid-binding Zn ribbon protein